MLFLVLALACLLTFLQIQVRRHIRQSATTFIRSGQTPATPSQQWILAAIAPQLMPLGLPIDSFRAPEPRRVPALTATLNRDWKITDAESLLRVASHLSEIGYRPHCAQVSSRKAEDFLAWDLLRYIWLLWSGWNLQWLSEAELMRLTANAAHRLQVRFPSWADAAASYEEGLAIWAREGKARKLIGRTRLTIETLLTHPESPWRSTPWLTEVVDTISE